MQFQGLCQENLYQPMDESIFEQHIAALTLHRGSSLHPKSLYKCHVRGDKLQSIGIFSMDILPNVGAIPAKHHNVQLGLRKRRSKFP
jgi:hypothetical protein